MPEKFRAFLIGFCPLTQIPLILQSNSNQLFRFLFLVFLLPTISWAQGIVSGFVINKENQPIDSVMVFFHKSNELNTISDTKGFFKIDYSDVEITGWKLTFYKEGYKEQSIPFKKLSDLMVVTLEPLIKKEEKIIYEDEIVELDEGTVYSSFAVDSSKVINSILDNIKLRHSSNYPLINTTYKVEGYHSLTEKLSEEREDTLLYLKNPLHLELTSYSDKNIHLNSQIALQPTSTLFVRNNTYNAPKDSPFFLYEQFSWIDFISKDFISKRRNYKYKILSQDETTYEIEFVVKKSQEGSWSGTMVVNKEDFAIIRLEVNLEFNRKNSYSIVSKNATKNATSIIYFEGAKIVWEFKKSVSGFYKINSLNSDYRIIHIGVNPDYTPQFLVKTNMKFAEESLPEEHKILPLNDLLFIAFQKNHAAYKD